MKIEIDLKAGTVSRTYDGNTESHPIGTPNAFSIVSDAWLRCGWDNKHVYSFTWMGRPIIQLPEDMVRLQEVIYTVKPDVIVETGIAHGGSLIYYASLCKAMGHGRVIGIDIEIRPHNRTAIESHELYADYITMFEGSSVAEDVVAKVQSQIKPGETVLVLLDSNHTKAHVAGELEAYAPLVSVGSYIVATDGIMGHLPNAPRSNPDWAWNNPEEAAREFADKRDDFVLQAPPFLFNEGTITQAVTYWPGAWLKRVR